MSDLRRAREIARESGETVEVTRDGTIRIVPAKPGEVSGSDLDKWLGSHADKSQRT